MAAAVSQIPTSLGKIECMSLAGNQAADERRYGPNFGLSGYMYVRIEEDIEVLWDRSR